MESGNDLIVNGYCFGSMEDAEAARQEVKKIQYLETHMDFEKPENMLLVYKKAVEGRVFQTPIGWEYLKELRRRLNSYEGIDKLRSEMPPITLYTVFAHRVGDEILAPEPRISYQKKKNYKNKLMISVILNIILIISVGAMFAIAVASNHPNIINYENALVNKYASWQQELTERENAVRIKERELQIGE